MSAEGKMDFVRVIAAYFVPPVGVFLQVGLGVHFWINIVLTLLGGLPGIVHALWVIASEDGGGRASEAGGSTFVALLLVGFVPPISVLMRKGVSLSLLLNCFLCLFLWVPGVVHAVWVVTHANK
jgi:uncharacterized membrane protein YqaE (UPF0057 family)